MNGFYAQEQRWIDEFRAVFPKYAWDALGIGKAVVLRGGILRNSFYVSDASDMVIVGWIYYWPDSGKITLKSRQGGNIVRLDFYPKSHAYNLANFNTFIGKTIRTASHWRAQVRREFYEKVRSQIESDSPAEARDGYQWALLHSDLSWRERLDLLRRYHEKHEHGEDE